MRNKETSPIKTEFVCPVCSTALYRLWGSKMNPHDKAFGLTLFCWNQKCDAQEVMGHANARIDADVSVFVKNAYAIIMARFKGEKLPSVETDEIVEVETEQNIPIVSPRPTKQEKKLWKINGKRVVKQEPEATTETEEALI